MSKKELKTNAMRMLDREKIPYTYETYDCGTFTDGIHVADQLAGRGGKPFQPFQAVTKYVEFAKSR